MSHHRKHRNRTVTVACEDGYVASCQQDHDPFEINADLPWFDANGDPHGKPVSITFRLNGVEVGTVYWGTTEPPVIAPPTSEELGYADDDAVSKGVGDGQQG